MLEIRIRNVRSGITQSLMTSLLLFHFLSIYPYLYFFIIPFTTSILPFTPNFLRSLLKSVFRFFLPFTSFFTFLFSYILPSYISFLLCFLQVRQSSAIFNRTSNVTWLLSNAWLYGTSTNLALCLSKTEKGFLCCICLRKTFIIFWCLNFSLVT